MWIQTLILTRYDWKTRASSFFWMYHCSTPRHFVGTSSIFYGEKIGKGHQSVPIRFYKQAWVPQSWCPRQASRPLARSPFHPSPMELTTAAQRCCGDLPRIPNGTPQHEVRRYDWKFKNLQDGPRSRVINGVMGPL